MAAVDDTVVKPEEQAVESPTSVLEDEDNDKEVEISLDFKDGNPALISKIKLEENMTSVQDQAKDVKIEISLDFKDGNPALISKDMLEENMRSVQDDAKDVKIEIAEKADGPPLNDAQFTKLDQLLTTTQLYSDFLLKRMDDITDDGVEEVKDAFVEGKKKGRGSKRKTSAQYDDRKAKRAVAAMLTRCQEGTAPEDADLTEEERDRKEQSKLVPLLTGGQMKSYQIKGLKWMISLYQNGLNGILADQMGLGKTIQTISFLAHLKGKGLHGPYLVIAPLSTLSNWINEIQRFVPSMKAIIYHGDIKTRDAIRKKHMKKPGDRDPDFPVIITSFEVAMADARKSLRQYKWKYVVVDEGHRLKNSNCKLVKELKYISMENKLLLTGTPLQNNLAELWSLLHFILPDIFSSLQEFQSWFDLSPQESNVSESKNMDEDRRAIERRRLQMVEKLHAILRPFLLRREKKDVEIMLPRKKEIILYARMTDYQRDLQDRLVNQNNLEEYLCEKAEERSGRGIKKHLNNMVIQLRKICNHPDLVTSEFENASFYPPVDEIVEQCGKFRLLERLLKRLFEMKHKVLIFSQWTRVLDIMDYYFSEKGFKVCRIDGNVKLDERRRQIDEFNNPSSECRIFLLSTRAGGLGINLTAADTCILYDSDWNPQMDLQAMDRCHRIGQTKPVHVYRLATAHSVEGRMLKRAYGKLKLEHVVIAKGQFEQERTDASKISLKEEDIIALLRHEEDEEEKKTQTEISDEDLEIVLDRRDLTINPSPDAQNFVYPPEGPGWEVVMQGSGGGLFTVNS